MSARIVPGTANRPLAISVAGLLGIEPVPCDVERFPDGELRPVVDNVRGEDVYVVQPTGPPVHEHLVELLLLLDACRRSGAGRVTAVVPYFGYARQDRRQAEGEAVGARVCADALGASGADRLVVVDPHTATLEAMCPMPVEVLSAAPVLAAALGGLAPDTVIVAPDLGAAALAERYAAASGRPMAVVRKARLSGEAVRAGEIAGSVAGRSSVIVDDMISTGATIEAAVGALRARGGKEVTVVATHAVLVHGAVGRLAALGPRRMLVTDTLAPARPPDESPLPPTGSLATGRLETCSVAPLLAEAIRRLHTHDALGDLRART